MAFFIVDYPPFKVKGTETAVYGAVSTKYKKDVADEAAELLGINTDSYKKGKPREVDEAEYNQFIHSNHVDLYDVDFLIGHFEESASSVGDRDCSLFAGHIKVIIDQAVTKYGATDTADIWRQLPEHSDFSTFPKALAVLYSVHKF